MTKTSTSAHLKGIHKVNQNFPADLIIAFDRLHKVLAGTNADMKMRAVDRFHYELWTEREIVVKSHRHKGVMFASIILFEHHLGFYFQPLYFIPALKEKIPDSLLPLQKGTTCFHLNNLPDMLLEDLNGFIVEGIDAYHSLDWI